MKLSKILSAVALTVLVACSPEFKYEVVPSDYVELGANNVVFTKDAATKTVSVEAGGTWKAVVEEAASEWLTAEPGDGIVSLTVAEHPGVITRKGVVTITSGNRSVTLNVTQMGSDIFFDSQVPNDTLEVVCTPSSATLNILSNLEWTVVPQHAWVTPSAYEGGGNTSIGLEIGDNVSLSERYCDVDFYLEDLRIGRVTVHQASVVPSATYSVASISKGGSAFSENITVNTNFPWKVVLSPADATWLTVTTPAAGTDGLVDKGSSQAVTVAATATTVARSGVVRIETGGETFDLTVSQSGSAATLNVDKTDLPLANTSASNILSIETNATWEVVDMPEWLTADKVTGNGNATVTFTAPDRTGSARSADITVKAGGTVTKVVHVAQSAGNYTVPIEFKLLEVDGTYATYSSPFDGRFESSTNNGYNKGVITQTLLSDPTIKIAFFSNHGSIVQNGTNGLRFSNNWKDTAADPSKSREIRDEDFGYIKFPAIEGLTLKKVRIYLRVGGANYSGFITTDPFVSNADATAKAVTNTAYVTVSGNNTYTLTNPQPNTEYYLFLTGNTVTYDFFNIYLDYEL